MSHVNIAQRVIVVMPGQFRRLGGIRRDREKLPVGRNLGIPALRLRRHVGVSLIATVEQHLEQLTPEDAANVPAWITVREHDSADALLR